MLEHETDAARARVQMVGGLAGEKDRARVGTV